MEEKNMMDYRKWAVVGATDNPQKFGYKIFKKLKDSGYQVYAVNPNCISIDGDPCYPNLGALPEVPEVVDMVVNPVKGLGVLEEAVSLGIKNMWLQPGTESSALLEMAALRGVNIVQGCVLVE